MLNLYTYSSVIKKKIIWHVAWAFRFVKVPLWLCYTVGSVLSLIHYIKKAFVAFFCLLSWFWCSSPAVFLLLLHVEHSAYLTCLLLQWSSHWYPKDSHFLWTSHKPFSKTPIHNISNQLLVSFQQCTVMNIITIKCYSDIHFLSLFLLINLKEF